MTTETAIAVLPASRLTPEQVEQIVKAMAGTKRLKSVAFDLSKWHAGPTCVRSFVPGIGGIGVKVCCAPCGQLCDVEATGERIPVADSWGPA